MGTERPGSDTEPSAEKRVIPEAIKVDEEENFLIRHKGEIIVIAAPLLAGILTAAGYEVVKRRRKR